MKDYPVKLSGHTLIREGSAHTPGGVDRARYGLTIGGPGHGKCSCGALSELLPNSARRREWHKDHKRAVVAAAAAPVSPTTDRTE